ncbi:hypothetical protein JM18_003408 [Phytophthora kernoviae]|uniref:PX domain-containing protein n=2 Tax=Phytophthora kernoviae TaxID=325452 RepID=A0A8T0M124_9STRA|nr:hypothetical protein G195_004484 [Phytophthora kernoviae 00238/432]KAG2526431.1 hypothetical protein JM16_003828 [Phytophthora kernoviae]KAG2528052.1 hypothetical protein JM18_003408 [Phytophthora kernoviae]
MGGGSWIVQEGYLLCRHDKPAANAPTNGSATRPPHWKPPLSGSKDLKELYVVLAMNRKMEFFDASDAATRSRVDSAYIQGFCGWDGDGLLKVDAYGLELKVERNARSRMYLAAFNRVDLEKWCRGFMAVLDPQSAAGEEVRRERRKVKKEEKRLQEEREEKIRKWKEKKAKMLQEEQDRLLAREEEINNMTPLERVDGLGNTHDIQGNLAAILAVQKKEATPPAGVSSDEDVSSDSDSDDGTSFFGQSHKIEATSPKNSSPRYTGAGGAGPNVVVLYTSSALRNEGKKSVGVFTFTLQFGTMEHSFSFTYSEFEETHTRLSSAFSGGPLPKFPSKHRLRNNTKPENMQKRAQEFRLYLQQLVAVPGMLSSERFQFEYHIDGAFARALANDQGSNKIVSNGAQTNGRPPRNSDPESDSDTSIDTPKPIPRQKRPESTASITPLEE